VEGAEERAGGPAARAGTRAGGVLVVAATPLELEPLAAPETLCCGIGPVEAALATARALERDSPAVLLHVGIAGARSLAPPALVLGSEAVYCDLQAPGAGLALPPRARPDGALLERARRLLPGAHVLPIATSARLGGGAAFEVEAMEGYAVLRAAAEADVPALELRAVSNGFGDPPARWRIGEALAALAAAVDVLLGALDA
jgi:nucleoside phosphorylase